jgi:hypothetical protein
MSIPLSSEISVSLQLVTIRDPDKLPAMRDYRLSNQELAELRAAHRAARDVRAAYRINAVILLGRG